MDWKVSARKEPELLGLALRSVRESKGMTWAELKQLMKNATSALGDYARLNGPNKRMADQMIGLFLRQQRSEGGE